MNKYEKLRSIVLIVGSIVVVLVIIIGGRIVLPKDEKDRMMKCQKVTLFNKKVGEEISSLEIESSDDSCYDKNNYYHITGYSNDINYLRIYVSVVKKDDFNWLTMNNVIIGNKKMKLDDAFKEGTRYCYTFIKNSDKYVLKSIEMQ